LTIYTSRDWRTVCKQTFPKKQLHSSMSG